MTSLRQRSLISTKEWFIRESPRSSFKIAIGPTTGFFDHSWLKLNFNLVRLIDGLHRPEDSIFEDCVDRF
jgi:hypothetical protein